jgi:two-component sensor histidine kinase
VNVRHLDTILTLQIAVARLEEDGFIVITYRDDGPGLAYNTSVIESLGFGMQLVRMTVESLDGRMQIYPGPGFHIEIRLPSPT